MLFAFGTESESADLDLCLEALVGANCSDCKVCDIVEPSYQSLIDGLAIYLSIYSRG